MMQKLYKGKDVCFCDSFYVSNFLKTGWSLSPEAEKPEAEKPEAEKPEAEKPEAEKPEAEKPKKAGRPPKTP